MSDREYQGVVQRMEANDSKWNSVKWKWNKKLIWFLKNFIQFFIQYITTIYLAVYIIYETVNWWHIFLK